ncbi:MAG TPA: S41 family peptidase, partial [Chroococcales cyanobacterium]
QSAGKRGFLISLISAVVVPMLGACNAASKLGSSSPTYYLDSVLNIIEFRALHARQVDWKAVRAKCMQLAEHAKTTTDTYRAINYALSQLHDNHSFLEDASGKRTLSSESSEPEPVRIKSSNLFEDEHGRIGLLLVGAFVGDCDSEQSQRYAGLIRNNISEILKMNPSAWIVDLRGNTGGNMWPMLAGVGPIIGGGTIGYFQYPRSSVPWFYQQGESGIIDSAEQKVVNFKLEKSIDDCEAVPVAVLIDDSTLSSGEAVALSFKGRPRTRFFGQHTGGLTTANETITLSDGAVLYLTTAEEADRNRNVYPAGLAPDVAVKQEGVPLGDKNDPVIRAARRWLSTVASD